MAKKFLSALLSVCLLLSFSPAAFAATTQRFTDVPATAWYYDDVEYSAGHGYFNGTGGGAFSPDASMTRAMFVTVLARLDGVSADDNVSPFDDVAAGLWYSGAVAWAAENEIVSGVGENNFAPNQPVTRQQMAALMARYLAYYAQKNSVAFTATGSTAAFSDASQIASWAAEAVTLCRSYGLLSGNPDGTFAPAAASTRAQVAAVVHRLALLLPTGTAVTKPVEGGSGGPSGGSQDTSSSRTVSDAAGFIDAAQVSATTVTATIGTTNSFTIYDDIAVTNNSAKTLTLDLGAAGIGNLTIASTSATTININGMAASVSSLTVNAPNATVNNRATVNGSIDIRAVSSSTFNNTGDVSGNITLSGPGSLNDTQTIPAPVVVATSETVAVLGNSTDISITADDAKLTVAPAGTITPVVSGAASGAELTVSTNNPVTISGTVGTVQATASAPSLNVQGSVGVLSTTAGTLEVAGGGAIGTMSTANTTVTVDSASSVSIDTLTATGGTINAPSNVVGTVAARGSVVLNTTVNTVTTAANTTLTLGQDASVNSVVASGDLTLSGAGAVNSVDVVSDGATNITKSDDATLSVAQVTTTGAEVTTALVATVLTKAARPMNVSFAVPTAAGGNGTITGADAKMEYRAIGTSTWTAISGTDGLSVAAGTYEVRVAATDTALASEPVTVAIPAAVAVSTAAIQGVPYVGQTLTAVANAAATGELGYVWKAGEAVIPGETRKTLTLTDAQIGKAVTVTISNYSDSSATSASTLAVTVDKTALTKLISKADEVQQGVSEKPNGTTAAQVARGIIFVTASEKSALLTVQNAAATVRDASTATTAEGTAQATALRNAIATYVAAKKTGTLDAVETLKTELAALISLAQSAKVTTEATESSAVEPSKNYVLAADNTAYTAAISTATAAKDAANATAATLSNAIKALNNAMAAYLKVIRTGASLDNTALTAATNAAEKSAASVVVNTASSNVLPGQIWVTQESLDTYNAAIAAAKVVTATVQNDYINALTTLNTATGIFNTAKASGTKDIIPPVVTVASAALDGGIVTVKFTSSEAGSYKYRLDRTEGAWTTPSDNTLIARAEAILTFPLSASSATVYVQVSDASGNTTVVSANVEIADPADTVASIGTAKYATLSAAVAAASDGQTVKLAKNVTLTETVSTEATFTLDLNGHSITGDDCRAILINGGTLTLGGTGTVSSTHTTSLLDSSSVIRVSGDSSAAKLIVLSGVTVSSDHCYGITLFGAANPQALDLYGTVAVIGPASAISGNGSAPNKSTTVNIYEGAVVSATQDAAIYHPEKGTLTIAGGTITGTGGIEAKAGSVVITGGTISSIADKTSHDANSNGTSTSGYSVALVENKAYSIDTTNVTVTITDGTFTGPVAKLTDSARTGEEALTITGGAFSDLSCMDYLGENADVAVNLAEDVTLTDSIRVTNGATLNLDLNGHKLSKASTPFIVYGGELNVTGTGTIEETVEDNYAAIMVFGSSSADASDYAVVTVDQDVTLSGWAPVFINRTNADDNTWGVPNTQDHAYGVSVDINGTLDSPSTTAPGHAAYINGTIKDTENCPAVTIGSTAKLTSKGTGIYAAGYADWTIEDGAEITGATGIEVRAGKMEIGAASVTGTALPIEVNPNGNGTATNGAGIAVAQHTTKLPIDVTLNGSIVKGYTAFYQSNPQKNSAEDIAKIKVSITGGAFTAINEGTNAVYSENLTCFVTGGTFSSDPGDYLAEGYVAAKDDTGDAWTVAPIKGGDTVLRYDSTKTALQNGQALWDVIKAAEDGTTIYVTRGVYELTDGNTSRIQDKSVTVIGVGNVELKGNKYGLVIQSNNPEKGVVFNLRNVTVTTTHSWGACIYAKYNATVNLYDVTLTNPGTTAISLDSANQYLDGKYYDNVDTVVNAHNVTVDTDDKVVLLANPCTSTTDTVTTYAHFIFEGGNIDAKDCVPSDLNKGSGNLFVNGSALEYVTAWDGTTTAEPKTEDGAYIVNDANEFAWFMGKSVTGQTIKLNKYINLGGHAWTPLANSNNFVIDGNGHTIRNFTLTMSGQDGLGMFGCKGVTGATIKNLVIEDATVTGTHIHYAGVLVGDFHDGTIEDITVRNVGVAGYKWVGAVAGQTVNSTLNNITVEGATVKATGDSKAGGVAGAWRFESDKDAGTAENLVVRDSTVTAFTKQAGGIFGNVDSRVTGIQMIDCVSEDNVIGSPVAASTACLVGDIYIGSDYPKGVILIIKDPVAKGNAAAESFSGPGITLVGGDMERWDDGNVADLPQADVTELDLGTITVAQGIGTVAAGTYPLGVGYKFETTESYDAAAAGKYAKWNADFVVTVDRDVTDAMLFGNYGDYGWIGIPASEVKANTSVRLLKDVLKVSMNYAELCQYVQTFSCGATDVGTSDAGTTMTVELRLYQHLAGGGNSEETGHYEVIGVYSHTF